MIGWSNAASLQVSRGIAGIWSGAFVLAALVVCHFIFPVAVCAQEEKPEPPEKRKKTVKAPAKATDGPDEKGDQDDKETEKPAENEDLPIVTKPAGKQLGVMVRNFQSEDKATHEAAAKELVRYGAYVYHILLSLRRAKGAAVAARAEEVRKAIEAEATRRFNVARKIYQRTYTRDYTPEGLEKLYNAYSNMGDYVVNRTHKAHATAMINRIRADLHRAKVSVRALADSAKQLAADPPPQGLVRAALQQTRASHLQNLRKYEPALEAVDDALKANAGGARLLPSLLLQKAQMLDRTGDAEGMLATCAQLLKECPRSLEVREAYELQSAHWEMEEDYVKQTAVLGAYMDAFPVDAEAEEMAYQTLDLLMDMEYRYRDAGVLAQMMLDKLPLSRIKPEIPYFRALIAEFVEVDYPTAEKTWQFLLSNFPDRDPDGRFTRSLERTKQKIAGTWPKSPKLDEPGPAGALARFHVAARMYDLAAVQKEAPAEAADDLEMSLDEFVPDMAFSDLLVLESKVDEKAGTAVLKVEQRLVEEPKPVVGYVKALKEGDAWKILWPEELGETEDKPAVPGGFVPPTQLPEKKNAE